MANMTMCRADSVLILQLLFCWSILDQASCNLKTYSESTVFPKRNCLSLVLLNFLSFYREHIGSLLCSKKGSILLLVRLDWAQWSPQKPACWHYYLFYFIRENIWPKFSYWLQYNFSTADKRLDNGKSYSITTVYCSDNIEIRCLLSPSWHKASTEPFVSETHTAITTLESKAKQIYLLFLIGFYLDCFYTTLSNFVMQAFCLCFWTGAVQTLIYH